MSGRRRTTSSQSASAPATSPARWRAMTVSSIASSSISRLGSSAAVNRRAGGGAADAR